MDIDDLLDDPLAAVQSKRKKKRQQLDLTQEDDSSLLADLGAGAMSGLSFVGGQLDKFTGSRALRGLLGGKPRELASLIPFSDTLGLTSREDITRGTDLIGAPKDTPLFSPEGGLGFGLEVLLDPTLPFTGFLKGGLTAAGKGLKTAGLAEDAVRAVSKAKGVGPRVAKMTSTAREVFANPTVGKLGNVAAYRKFEKAAEGAGKKASDLLDMPLGGNLEFWPTGSVLGKAGGAGERIAQGMDTIGDAIRWGNVPFTKYSPGRHAAQLFDSSVMGMESRVGQEHAQDLYRELPKVRSEAQEPIYQGLQELKKVGVLDDTPEDVWRQFEGIDPLSPEYAPSVQRSRQAMAKANKEARAIGAGSKTDIEDEFITPENYTPRFAQGVVGKQESKIMGASDPSQLGRKNPLKDIEGGTGALSQMVKDPDIGTLGAPYLESMYGHLLPFHDAKRIKKLATTIKGMQEGMARGGSEEFFQHPLASQQTHLLSRGEAAAKGHTGLNIIAEKLGPHVPKGQTVPEGFVRVRDVVPELGLRFGNFDEGAIKALADKSGKPISVSQAQFQAMPLNLKTKQQFKQAVFSSIADRVIPKEVAADVMRLKGIFDQPEEVSKLIGAVDSVTNLFKAGVLTWPARYARDFLSGQVNAFLGGMWSHVALRDAHSLVNGKPINAMAYPVVKQMLDREGLPHTAENAMQMLRTHLASMELIGAKQSAVSQVGQNVGQVAATLKELEHEIPGMVPMNLTSAAKELKGKDWNPLNVKGVFGRKETTMAPVRAGNELGTYTDSLNRLQAYLHQIKKGVDPFEARAKVVANQVDYSTRAYTTTERVVMKRLLPFYSFTKGMLPWVFKHLANEPSGRLAQVVRGQGRARDEDQWVPSHISQTAAIPIPGAPEGFQRFISSLGLMHEDPFSLLRPGQTASKTVQGTLQEMAGRLNPIIKGPMELAAGKQLFSGRELQDLEGNVSQIAKNITGKDVKAPLLLEQALSNSPASRLLTTARTLTDSRKGIGAKATNLLSGVRVTDADLEKGASIGQREAIEDLLRGEPGVSMLRPHLSVREEDMAKLTDKEKKLLTMYKALGAKAQKAAREKKKAAGK